MVLAPENIWGCTLCAPYGVKPRVDYIGVGCCQLVSEDDAENLAGALERVLTDPELRRVMRAQGLQQASRFSWETAARRTYEIYHVEGGAK